MNDVFKSNNIKSLPSYGDLKNTALHRGFSYTSIKGKKKEELATFLNIPLIFNPNYIERTLLKINVFLQQLLL